MHKQIKPSDSIKNTRRRQKVHRKQLNRKRIWSDEQHKDRHDNLPAPLVYQKARQSLKTLQTLSRSRFLGRRPYYSNTLTTTSTNIAASKKMNVSVACSSIRMAPNELHPIPRTKIRSQLQQQLPQCNAAASHPLST